MSETFGAVPADRVVGVPRLVAEGTDTVPSTGTAGVALRDLTALVSIGETLFISAEEVVTGSSVAMPLGIEREGIVPGAEGVLFGVNLYLSYGDLATHAVSICCNNFNDNDAGLHWKVWAL